MLTKHETYTMRGGGATKKLFVALLVALLAALTLTPPAFGAVKDGRTIEGDYGIDFVVLNGYPANTNVRVDVLRGPNDVVVGSTTQKTSSTGLLEINHVGGGQFGAGGDCWGPSTLNPNAPNVTPDILPGDKIQSTVLNADGTPVDPADVDFTVARDIFIDTGATTVDTANNTITMKGHVRSTPNALINTAAEPLELRLNASGFTWQSNNGRRDLRDNVSAADFTADGDGDPTTFAHVFSVSDTDANNADGNNFEQIFEWAGGITDPPPELTVFSGEGGVLGGCPPHAKTAVTGVSTHTVASKPVVNTNNIANDMVVGGIANGAETVSVSIPGGQPHEGVLTPAFDSANPNANQTWTATIPKEELAALGQGQFNITANFTGVGVPASSTLSALKDTENPAAPTASIPAGRYSSAQSVTLNESDADPAVKIYYTIGQTPPDPDATDNPFTRGQPIQVTATQTIKAVVVDGAGNVSPVATFAYTIGANTVPAAPAIGTATAGNRSATVNWTAPDNGGSAITEYRVRVTNANNNTTVRNVSGISGNATSTVISNLTNGTNYKFSVRAVNSLGVGSFSGFSNTVTPSTTVTPPPTGGGTQVGLPSQPLNVTAAQDAAGTAGIAARVSWAAPADNGGAAITQYRVKAIRVTQAGAVHTNQPTNPFQTAAASARTLRFTGLVQGAFYKFEVQASNTPAGQTKVWGPASGQSNQVTAR
jgi:Fibronectin type III domain/Chitobiase/beta-hexosaminidase C-terminal domain